MSRLNLPRARFCSNVDAALHLHVSPPLHLKIQTVCLQGSATRHRLTECCVTFQAVSSSTCAWIWSHNTAPCIVLSHRISPLYWMHFSRSPQNLVYWWTMSVSDDSQWYFCDTVLPLHTATFVLQDYESSAIATLYLFLGASFLPGSLLKTCFRIFFCCMG